MAAMATSIPVKLIIGTGDYQIELGEAELPFDAHLNPGSLSFSLDSASLRAGLVELLRTAADQIEMDELAARRNAR